ncbi:hypothetical protein [Natronosalvus halobius]|nr:hypothetical protein [Natronosalvus halobius]USZ71403.1 hypothetical protein NGM15_15185 [Natronosalvus halobius]
MTDNDDNEVASRRAIGHTLATASDYDDGLPFDTDSWAAEAKENAN